MFSEYASRFLSQSQLRTTLNPDSPQSSIPDRHNRWSRSPKTPAHKSSHLGRSKGNPYQYQYQSQFQFQHHQPYRHQNHHPSSSSSTLSSQSFFPFASRTTYAPLFYSANDELNEEDEQEEHAKEVADFYALQRSRRQFGANSRLKDSSSSKEKDTDKGRDGEEEDDDEEEENDKEISNNAVLHDRSVQSAETSSKSPEKFRNTTATTTTNTTSHSPSTTPSQSGPATPFPEEHVRESDDLPVAGPSRSRINSASTITTTTTTTTTENDRMVDIKLEDTLDATLNSKDKSGPPNPFGNKFHPHKNNNKNSSNNHHHHHQHHGPFHPDSPQPSDISDTDSITFGPHEDLSGTTDPDNIIEYVDAPGGQSYDVFWGNLFLICLGGLFASALLVYLHTSPPPSTPSIGDTIYSTLHASFHLLGKYTVVTIMVSLIWLALMRAYVRFIVYGMLIAVPVILYSFSIYSFASSFKGYARGTSLQDKVMRWSSLLPAIIATLWTYTVIRSRHVTGKAINTLSFACRILAANPALLPLGFATLIATVLWTWIWVLMFTRVFLGGHLSIVSHVFIIDLGTWWLGVYFVLVHLWCLAVISGVQRAVTAATVSQWYFHRLVSPSASSWQIVQAAMAHSVSMLFGTICLSSLLSLLVRLPLMLLPKRCASIVSYSVYYCVPTPIATLTDPLAITHASIHSLPLKTSARSLSHLPFLSPANGPIPTQYRPAYAYGSPSNDRLVPYRIARLILHANRLIMSLSLGFGGWVISARSLRVPLDGGENTVRGSMYAYVVGLVAGVIGWGVIGAVEGILGVVLDAAVVCWASEVGLDGREARYCREAGELFGPMQGGGGGSFMRHKDDFDEQGLESGVWRDF